MKRLVEELAPGLLGCALMLAVLGYATWLETSSPELYYQAVQEDEYLEWATFWAFLLAAVASVVAGLRQRRGTGQLPWFLFGVGLFSFVVAMEEISWAQRVFGYRPPAYFLEHNFQQEFNVHNVMDTSLRKLAFRTVIIVYGIALPLVGFVPPLRRLLGRLAIVPPSVLLVPGFAASLWADVEYPWQFSGEIVELAVGLGFLFPAVVAARELGAAPARPRIAAQALAVALAGALTLGLGVGNAAVSRTQRSASPEALEQTRQELEALRNDFFARAERRGNRLPVRCGIHKRIYTYVEQYRQRFLTRGEYASLTEQGLPEQRAEFFLDPWNYAYWIRSKCSKDREKRRVFIYSFGPNRLRDSSEWEIVDDDVGLYMLMRDPGDEDGEEPDEEPSDTEADPTV